MTALVCFSGVIPNGAGLLGNWCRSATAFGDIRHRGNTVSTAPELCATSAFRLAITARAYARRMAGDAVVLCHTAYAAGFFQKLNFGIKRAPGSFS